MKKYPYYRNLFGMCKKMAKINLTKLFNKCVVKPIKRPTKKIKNFYREKIKTEYLYRDIEHKCIHTHGKFAKNVKFIEFNDMSYPSLREQILKSSKVYHNIGMEVNSNYILEKSTTKYQLMKMSSGRYLNFGIENALNTYLSQHPNLKLNNSYLDLSVGMYVIKSTTDRGVEIPKYLILLGKIANILHYVPPNHSNNTSFIIAVYEGSFPTPTIANEILRPFVDEMKELTTKTPIQLDGRKISRIGLHAFIVDPIAHSILTCTSLPASLYGCSKCRVKSELRVNQQMSFSTNITSFPTSCTNDNLRLDEDFKYCLDSDYHLDVPIVMELNVPLVSQTAIDYKHRVCLGVMKELVSLWTKGKLDYRINRSNWLRILKHLELIISNCPDELQKSNFNEDLNTWDAYHWKLFLVHFGPVVLQNHLPRIYYIHFLYLNLASRIMINQYKSRKHSALVVGIFFKRFTTDFATLYGEDFVDYNVHNLIHFEETISQLGSIESVGGFMYEDQFNFINSLIEYNSNISVEEIAEEILYKNTCLEASKSLPSISDKPYHVDQNFNLIFDNFLFNNQHPNSYVLSKKGVLEIIEIINNCNTQIVIFGRKFECVNIMYHAPLNEEKLFR